VLKGKEMVAVANRSSRPGEPKPPLVGAHIEVHMSRGRTARRNATVLDVRAFEGTGHGRVIVVRWDDDDSVSSLVPGADVEVL
jgi:hypothetical protein